MTIRDIPQELLRNAERRRRKRESEELGARIIEAVLYVLILAGYCLALKAFIK